jgi:hypothetical protein
MGIQRRQYWGWIFALPAVLFFAFSRYFIGEGILTGAKG